MDPLYPLGLSGMLLLKRNVRTWTRLYRYAALFFAALLLSLIALQSSSLAAPNYHINYQGKLTDTTGAAVPDGTYNMWFWLLTSPSAATTTALWEEQLTGSNRVQVTNGLFSIMLGSTSPLTSVDFNQTLYLGVEIGGTGGSPSWDGEMSPRKILGTVPSAFEAEQFGGLATTSFVRSDQADTISASTASTLLTITQSGAGDILNIFDGASEVFSILDGGNVGVGSSTPGFDFVVGGDLQLTGSFYDSAYSAGSNGQILQTTGSGVAWVATSSLGITSEDLSDNTLDDLAQTALSDPGADQLVFWDDSDNQFEFISTLTDLSISGNTLSVADNFLRNDSDDITSGSLTATHFIGSSTNATTTLAGSFAIETSGFVYDRSTNFVGIGTAVPGFPLEIRQTGAATVMIDAGAGSNNSLIRLRNGGTSRWAFGNLGSDSSFRINAGTGIGTSDFLTITSTGNIGIATSAPASKLDVWGNFRVGTSSIPLLFANSTNSQFTIHGNTQLAGEAYYPSSQNLGSNPFQGQLTSVEYVNSRDFNNVSNGNFTHIDSDDQGGTAYGVWGDGKFVYLANSTGGLHVYAVSTTGILTHRDSDDQGANAYTVWGDGKFVYVANGIGGLLSYSVSATGTLTFLDSDASANAIGVWGDGRFIYLADDTGGLRTYTVADDGTLALVDTDDQGGFAFSIWGDGKFIYLANNSGGLLTYSVSDTGVLTHIDTDDQGGIARDVWGDGKFIYLANDSGGLLTYSVSDTGVLTHIDTDDQGGNARRVWGDGKYVYIANNTGGIVSYSVSDTGILTFIDSDNQGDDGYGVWGDGKFVYLANSTGGLHTYSIGNSYEYDKANQYHNFLTGNLGIGTSTPNRSLTIDGTMGLTGALYDRLYSAGTNGQILQTTGSGVQWVATSSLGFSTGTISGSGASTRVAYFSDTDTLTSDAGFTFASNILTIPDLTITGGDLVFSSAATTTVANNNPYAFTIATSTVASPLFRIDTASNTVVIGSTGGDIYIGDVGSASDLIFEESSTIHGQGENTITFGQSGDVFNFAVNLGIGTSTPNRSLTIDGTMGLTGALYDRLYSAGTNGQILQTTGSGVQWVATSSLGLIDGTGASTRVAYFSDTDTLTTDAGFTFASNILTAPSFAGSSATATTTLAGGLAIQTNGLVYDLSTGNVGIGTASPLSPLHLITNVSGNALYLQENSGAENWRIGVDSSGDLNFANQSGSTRVEFGDLGEYYFYGNSDELLLSAFGDGTSGFFGIGDSGPDANLEVSADGVTTGSLFMLSSNDNANGDLLTFTRSGNLGIGTITPSEKLSLDDGLFLNTEGDLAKVGGLDTNVSNKISIVGDHAFVAQQIGSLSIVNISDSTNPVVTGSVSTAGAANEVVISGDYAYVATDSSGDDIEIFDISNLEAPSKVGGADGGANVKDIVLSGNYAYAASANATAELQIFDVSDPTNPLRVGTANASSSALGIAKTGHYVYLVGTSAGEEIEVFDVSDPTNPLRVGTADTDSIAYDIAISGDYAYLALDFTGGTNDFEIYDISSSTNPVEVAGVNTGGSVRSIKISGDYAYVTNAVGGSDVIVYDISSSTNPQNVGTYDVGNNFFGIDVAGNYIYIVGDILAGQEFEILSASGIRTPTAEIGTLLADIISVKQSLRAEQAIIQSGINVGKNALIGGSLTVSGGGVWLADVTPATTTNTLYNSGGTLYFNGSAVGGGSSLFTDGGATTYLTSLNDNLSVGTSTSLGLLTVATSSSATALAVRQYGTGDLLNIFDSTTEVFTILDGGNVGIGTTTPSVPLDVWGDFRIGFTGEPNALFVDASLARVGIGTNSLSNAGLTILDGDLTIREDDNGNDAARLLAGNSTASFQLNSNGTANIFLASAASSPTYFNAGDVGIGTTSPYAKLSVWGDSQSAAETIFSVVNSASSTLFNVNADGTINANNGSLSGVGSITIADTGQNEGLCFDSDCTPGISIFTTAQGGYDAFNFTSDSGFPYIFNTSNVGIGTTTPDTKLTVNGLIHQGLGVIDVASTNTFHNDIVIDNTAPFLRLRDGSTDLVIDYDAQVFNISTESTADAFTIVDSGNVGIGTTTPGAKLTVHNGRILQTVQDPIAIGQIADTGSLELTDASDVEIVGNYAYVTAYTDGFQIIDISDPTNPVGIGGIAEDGSVLLGGAMGIDVVGQYAYVVSQTENALSIIDISNPEIPSVVGSIADAGSLELSGATDIVVSGNYAYVASETDGGVQIIDISDPTNPTAVGQISDGGALVLDGARGIDIQGDYLYVIAGFDSALNVIDISDPTNPTVVGTLVDDASTELSGASGIVVSSKYAYVAGYLDDGIQIIDISSSTNPTAVARYQNDAGTLLDNNWKVALTGDYLYTVSEIEGGVQVFDVSSSTNIIPVGQITDTGSTMLNGTWGIAVAGNYVYVTAIVENGLQILDIGGLRTPTAEIGTLLADNAAVTELLRVGRIDVSGGLNVGQDTLLLGDAIVAGKFGVGTSSPFSKFAVTDTVAAAQAIIAYDDTRWTELQTDSAGDFIIEPSGGDAYLLDENLYVCSGGACPSGTPSGTGNLIVETRLGVGSSTPFAHISVGADGAIVTTEKALTDSATINVNWTQGNQQKVVLGGDRTINFSNYINGQTLRLVVCQDGTGSRVPVWGTNIQWNGGTAPTLTTTADKCDILTFIATGATSTTKVFGSSILDF